MNALQIFNDVRNEYSGIVAADVLAVYSIYSSMTFKKKDNYIVGEAFKKRLRKKAKKALWECDESHLDHVIKIALAYGVFHARQGLIGFGGCTYKTLRELADHDPQ